MDARDLGLPRSGPLPVRRGYAAKTIAKAVGLGVLLATLCGAGVWVTQDNLGKVLHTSRVWRDGTAATGNVAFEGEVTTSNFVLKSYDLQVQFTLPDGAVSQFECKFDRFFTGPSEDDPMEVRYLEADPAQATSSWQHDALGHMWVWIAITGALTAFAGFGAVYVVVTGVTTMRRVRELAYGGQLVAIDILGEEAKTVDKSVTVTLQLRLPDGSETTHQFQAGRADPFFLDEGQRVLALCSLDGGTIHPLRSDGDPLDLAPLGIIPGVG